ELRSTRGASEWLSIHAGPPDACLQTRCGRGETPEHRVVVVQWDTGADENLHAKHTGGDQRIEREQELGDPPVVGILCCWSVCAVHGTPLGVHDFILRRAVFHSVIVE